MPAQAVTGSWWGLVSVYRQSRQEFEAFTSNPPMACPDDGEPLRNAPATPSGSGTELFCPYDGWAYPKDQHRPVRLLAGPGRYCPHLLPSLVIVRYGDELGQDGAV